MAQWLMGDWPALMRLRLEDFDSHPERARIALLVACAHQQGDHHEAARRFARQALAWGCSPALMARLLISGTHNTLGRIAALREDSPGIEAHFRAALTVTGDPQAPTAAHARAVREMARLGLLPQAAALVDEATQQIGAAGHGQTRPVALEAQVTMLRSEIELLQHELSLAQQRGNALGGAMSAAPGSGVDRQASTAQLGQDLWVLERSGGKRGGFFVEFGATDGVRLSNTWLLEQRHGWHGICIEPNPRSFARLQANRQCITSNLCIGPHTGDKVRFVLAEEYGGLVDDMAADMHGEKRAAYAADPANLVEFETVSLHDALTRLGAPRDIDYLSIDTEGSEYAILQAFPFHQWRIRLITVEHNFSPMRDKIRNLLEPLGYRRTEAQWDDWYELHEPA
ncbi:FkbM family methyltransferase [Rubrivivax albus]|nr:FkbM family methyltransferase [Rubrivivax albus]